jgi:hypothetical protein
MVAWMRCCSDCKVGVGSPSYIRLGDSFSMFGVYHSDYAAQAFFKGERVVTCSESVVKWWFDVNFLGKVDVKRK